MRSSTVLNDGSGNITLENDASGHTIYLQSGTSSRIIIQEDGATIATLYRSQVNSITLNLNDGNDAVTWGSWSFDSAYAPLGVTVNGGAGNDNLVGTMNVDALSGGDGNDTITPRWGNEVVSGGAGDDYFYGAGSNQQWVGGDGVDIVDFAASNGAGNPTKISIDDVANDIDGTGHIDNVGTDIENILTGKGADLIVGSSAANVIRTGGGKDTIYGGDGDDVIYDGTHADLVYGEGGNDTFTDTGEYYNDKDSIYGGDGNDYFVGYGDTSVDFLDGGLGIDTVEGTDAYDILTSIEAII